MNLVKCNKGHFYDSDKFPSCPHCGPVSAGGDSVTVAMSSGSSDVTVAMGGGGGEPMTVAGGSEPVDNTITKLFLQFLSHKIYHK